MPTGSENKNYNEIRDNRLEVARLLCKQKGLNWTGLSTEESDKLLDLADAAVKGRNKVFEPEAKIGKTQGEKTRQDHLDDAEEYGRQAHSGGRIMNPLSYDTKNEDPEIQAAWAQGWTSEENKDRAKRGLPPMMMTANGSVMICMKDEAPAKTKANRKAKSPTP